MGHCAGKRCPEGSSSHSLRVEVRAKGKEEEAEQSHVCVSVCTALPSRSTSEATQRRGHICWAGAGCVSAVPGAGGHVWRPAVTVNALQSSPAASQASSREFWRFPFSSGGHCFALISILYFSVVILGGRRGGTTKLLGRSFSVNALSPFHHSVLPRSPLWMLHHSKLSVVVNLLKSYILLAWCKFFSCAWFCWKSSVSLIRAFSTVTLQFL